MAGAEGRAAGAAASASVAASPHEPGGSRRRRRAGVIDLGGNILKAKDTMPAASECLAKAPADAERMKRKKDKLLRKAENLTLMDLARIALLKRSGALVPRQWPPDDSAVLQQQHLGASPTEHAAAPSSSASTCATAASSGPSSSPATSPTRTAGTLNVKVECSSGSEDDADGVADCAEDEASQ